MSNTIEPHDLIPPPAHDRVDPFVQRWVAGTNGNLYAPLINKLPRYPIPVWPGQAPARPGELLLDIGCGWGRWLVSAGQKGYLPLGIDIKIEALKAARRVLKAHQLRGYVVGANLERLPFQSGVLDMVYSYSVIQHVHRDTAKACLEDIARVLRPGGRTLLEFPIQPGLTNWRHKIPPAEEADFNSWCVRYYKHDDLRNLLNPSFEKISMWPDCYFGIGLKREDLDILPWKYKPFVVMSEALRMAAQALPPVAKLADSIYVAAQRPGVAAGPAAGAGDPDHNLWILPLLRCPLSGDALRHDRAASELVAEPSGIRYPVVDDIPLLIPSEARHPAGARNPGPPETRV